METRVLIVEDEATLRRSLAVYLAGRGVAVAEAGSLAEARAALACGCFDALILDVGLPDGDGLELLAAAGVRRALVVSAVARSRALRAPRGGAPPREAPRPAARAGAPRTHLRGGLMPARD